MPSYDLAALAAQQGLNRDVTLSPIDPTQALENDLGAIFLAPVKAEATRLKQTVLPIYAATVDQQHTDALKGALYGDQQSMARDAAIAGALILPFMRRTEAWQVNRWGQVVKSATGVDVRPILLSADAEKAVDTAAQRATTALNGGLDAFRQRIDGILWNGLAQGKSRLQITADLNDALAMAVRRARNTGLDQALHTVGDLNRFRQTQAGLGEYVWQHHPSKSPRYWHVARRGKVYSWSTPPYDGPPGTLPYCRCTANAFIRARPILN